MYNYFYSFNSSIFIDTLFKSVLDVNNYSILDVNNNSAVAQGDNI